MLVRDVRDSQRESQTQTNWKPKQKGPENWPPYLKMKGAVPSAHTSANYHCQKVWSCLKNALNKLSGGVTEENKGGLGEKVDTQI